MPYTAEISRTTPSCFLFLIDQSGSMQDALDPSDVQAPDKPMAVDGRRYAQSASGRTKAQVVADAVDRLLQSLAIKCAKQEGVRDYYHVGVIGYGGDGTANGVGPAFSGSLVGRELVALSEVANNPARVEAPMKKVEDGAGGLVDLKTRFPIWFEPVASGGTPMCQAFARAHTVLHGWLQQHTGCFPPIVINITDGEATDGDPLQSAEAVRSLSSSDGNVLLFNVHVLSQKASHSVPRQRKLALRDQSQSCSSQCRV